MNGLEGEGLNLGGQYEANAVLRGEEWKTVVGKGGGNKVWMPRVTKWKKFEGEGREEKISSGRFEAMRGEEEEEDEDEGEAEEQSEVVVPPRVVEVGRLS